MDQLTLRKKFIDYFVARGHKACPPDTLVPKNDPSALFTVAGMQQFKPFYIHPDEAPAPRVVTIQPCIRTIDIDEVGDNTHSTIFEMMGNFSFGYAGYDDEPNGPYFRKQAIQYAWEFLTQELQINPNRITATYFGGDAVRPRDEESRKILTQISELAGIDAGGEDNFWGPVGDEGACGPTVEFYVDGVEVWNIVLNEYYCDSKKEYTSLTHQGVDTGMGFERLVAMLQNKASIYESDLLKPVVDFVQGHSLAWNERDGRIIADHTKAALFLLTDGVTPGNKGRDYIARRLIRRATRLSQTIKFDQFPQLMELIADIYREPIPKVREQLTASTSIFETERKKFLATLNHGLKALTKFFTGETTGEISGTEAFKLFDTYGFPVELTRDISEEHGWTVDLDGFEKKYQEHQNISRRGMEKIFTGGLADHEPQTIAHHTAHHLLLAALRRILGPHVVQRGSNITSERLRIDVSHPQPISRDELQMAEDLVNQKIAEDLPMVSEKMDREVALASGAQAEFGQKYGAEVTVYSIIEQDGSIFSRELCGGPHVASTGTLGHFAILKEESAGAGIRRIRAKLTDK